MMQQPEQMKPFKLGTRLDKIMGSEFNVPTGGGSVNIPLPKNGLVSRLWLKLVVQGTTNATVPTWANALEQAYALIKNINLRNNQGLQVIPALSGYGARMLAMKYRRAYDPNNSTGVNVALPGASSTFTWVFLLPINIAFNQGLQTETGLLVAQSNTTEWTLRVDFENMQGGVLGATTLSALQGRVALGMEFFEIPDPRAYESAPLNTLFVTEEETVPASFLPASGTFRRDIAPLQGDMVRVVGQFVGGATPATYAGYAMADGGLITVAGGTPFVRDVTIRLANINVPEVQDAVERRAWHFDRYGANPLAGEIVMHDAAYTLGHANELSYPYGAYQLLNPSLYSTLTMEANVSSNGGTPAFVRVLKQYIQLVEYSG